jgi:formate hydrogenlyase transcriptional activator
MFRHPELDFLRHSYNFGFKEEMLIRLVHSGKVIGVFVLFSRTLDRFTEKDAVTLQSLSSLVAVALNNILANQEIENLSRQLQQDNIYLNEEIKSNYNFEEIIGESRRYRKFFKK